MADNHPEDYSRYIRPSHHKYTYDKLGTPKRRNFATTNLAKRTINRSKGEQNPGQRNSKEQRNEENYSTRHHDFHCPAFGISDGCAKFSHWALALANRDFALPLSAR